MRLKKYILLFASCLAMIIAAHGQASQPAMAGAFFVPTPASITYVLDSYPATAAYSLNQLSSTATKAVRVRRSTDNSEEDEGFVSGHFDTTEFKTFTSGGNGYVSKIYDQSGNGNDISQSTGADQLQIVINGNLTGSGNCAAFLNSDGNRFMNSSLVLDNSNYSAFFVRYHVGINSSVLGSVEGSGADYKYSITAAEGSVWYFGDGTSYTGFGYSPAAHNISGFVATSATSRTIYAGHGVSQNTQSSGSYQTDFTLKIIGGYTPMANEFDCILIYNTGQSSGNVTGIMTAMGNIYGL